MFNKKLKLFKIIKNFKISKKKVEILLKKY